MILSVILISLQVIGLIITVFFIFRLRRAITAFDKLLFKFIDVNQTFYQNQQIITRKIIEAVSLLTKDKSITIEVLRQLNKIMEDCNMAIKDFPNKLVKMDTNIKEYIKNYSDTIKGNLYEHSHSAQPDNTAERKQDRSK